MKNLKKFAEEICATLVSLLLIAIIIFAMKQEIFSALAILLSVAMLQQSLNKSLTIFSWRMKLRINFKACTDAPKINFRNTIKNNKREFCRFLLNSLFNTTKVLLFFSIIYVALRNNLSSLNFFGTPGVLIMLAALFFFIFSIFLNYQEKIRSVRKQVLGLSRSDDKFAQTKQCFISPFGGICEMLMVLTIFFVLYLTFGTNLIWLTMLMLIFYFLFSGMKKINKIIAYIIVGGILLSLIVQFWGELFSFFIIEIFYGFYVWTITLVLLLILISIKVVLIVYKNQKNEREKKEEQRRESERRERERKERAVGRETLRRENSFYIENLEKGLQFYKRTASAKEVIGLAEKSNKVDFEGVEGFNAKLLTGFSMISLLQISDIKQKIVWDGQSLDNIIKMFEHLYKKKYNDEELNSISSLFNRFISDLKAYKEYAGYDKLVDNLKGVAIPFNKKELFF